jgi:hypothetical protein
VLREICCSVIRGSQNFSRSSHFFLTKEIHGKGHAVFYLEKKANSVGKKMDSNAPTLPSRRRTAKKSAKKSVKKSVKKSEATIAIFQTFENPNEEGRVEFRAVPHLNEAILKATLGVDNFHIVRSDKVKFIVVIREAEGFDFIQNDLPVNTLSGALYHSGFRCFGRYSPLFGGLSVPCKGDLVCLRMNSKGLFEGLTPKDCTQIKEAIDRFLTNF